MNISKKMKPKTAVITGATGGIGVEICKYLLKNGYRVLAAIRSLQKGELLQKHVKTAMGSAMDTMDKQLILVELDLGSFGSVKRFSEQVITWLQAHETVLDLLINNAGMIAPQFRLTEDGYESSLQVNYLAPRRLTEHLLPYLPPQGKIINTVSCTIRVAHPEFPGNKTLMQQKKEFGSLRNYSNAKLWFSLYTIRLQQEYPELLICGADPGIVDTGIITQHRWYDPLANLFFRPFIKRPAEGALPILRAIEYRDSAECRNSSFLQEPPPLLFKGSRVELFHPKIRTLALKNR